MMHFPTHERQAFLAWIDDDFPNEAQVEEDYVPLTISADELLRRFLLPTACTDVMPGEACQQVADHLGYDGDARGISYGVAAAALLVARAADEDAACAFLGRLLDAA